MARITTEDCEHLVDGRFELVAIAAERTKQLISGAHPIVDTKNDKAPVTALRELASNTRFLKIDDLRNALIARLRKHAIEDHSNDQDTSLADDLMATENLGFLPESDEFNMFSEEEGFDGNIFADDISGDDDDR